MPKAPFADILRYLHACASQGTCDLADRELLERFLTRREESAFAVLVRRHGPMVMGVCRRVLGDSHETEDVFQATFLVLVRRAGSIRRLGSVGGWLHGVAQRVALKALTQTAARRRREREASAMRTAPVTDFCSEEFRSALDKALSSVPEKYRTPLVLCYLEGKTYEQAAQELGASRIALARRLTRGRVLLRRQLERCGISLSVAALTTALTETASAALLPAVLTVKTVKAAALAATGKAIASGCLTARALALAEEANLAALWSKSKLALVVLALGLTVGGAGWAGLGGSAAPKQLASVADAPTPAAKKQQEAAAKSDANTGVDQYGDPLPAGALARLGTIRLRHDHRTADLGMAFSPDTKIVLTVGNGVLKRWDVATGKLLGSFAESRWFRVLYAPNGKWLTIGDDLVDATTGQLVRRLGYPYAFSADSKLLATHSDEAVVLWNTATGEAVHKLGKDKHNLGAAFAADGRTLVTLGRGTEARHWDLSNGALLRSVSVPVEGWRTLRLSPDGKTIAFVRKQEISLWDTTTGQLLGMLGPEAAKARYGIAYTPDARTLATDYHDDETGEARICIWDVASRKLLRQFNIPSHAGGFLHFAPDNRTLASTAMEPRLRLWDTATGKPLQQDAAHDKSIGSLAFTPDGQTVLSSSDDGTVRVWNAADGRTIRALPERRGGLTALAVTPDGQAVLSGGYDATLLLQDWRTGKELRRLVLVPKEKFLPDVRYGPHLALAPDGRTAVGFIGTGAGQSLVQFWDLADGRAQKPRIHQSADFFVGLSPDTRLLASSHLCAGSVDAAPSPRGKGRDHGSRGHARPAPRNRHRPDLSIDHAARRARRPRGVFARWPHPGDP